MPTLIIFNEDTEKLRVIDAISIDPVFEEVEKPAFGFTPMVEKRSFFGGTKMVRAPQEPIIELVEQKSLEVSTAEEDLTIDGIGFTEYADLLTKSSNGVVDISRQMEAHFRAQQLNPG